MSASVEAVELRYRLHQQELLSAFGEAALRADDLDDLLQRATEICAEGLKSELCKILEYRRDEGGLLVRAGVGWDPGVVGNATVGSDLASPAGYAFKTGRAIVSNHLGEEDRFRTPELLVRHGVKRAINVLIETRAGNFGVLEVDAREEGSFEAADTIFMQSFANLIGVAIDRHRVEGRLQASIERQELLGHELNHRVKNVYAVVTSLVSQSAREAPEAEAAFAQLRDRIHALSLAHDVSLGDGVERGGGPADVELRGLVTQLLRPYGDDAARFDLVGPDVSIARERVMPFGLILHELATNAAKYGALSQPDGRVSITWALVGQPSGLRLIWQESGGPPADLPGGQGFGTRLIGLAARQLEGEVIHDLRPEGLHLELAMPI